MDAVPVVWMATAPPSGPSAVSTAARPAQADRSLEEWGRARGYLPRAPEPAPEVDLRVDGSIADAVEAELEKGREATSALDADGAERALAQAERLLRDHPELPQGAWLMAEVERGWAVRWSRVAPREPERATAAWRRARGLDGGRLPGLGEEAAGAAEPEVEFVLAVDGVGSIRFDGVPVVAGPLRATAAEHQVIVSRAGKPVWAGWVGVSKGATVRLAPPEPGRCTAEELSRASLEGGAVRADGVECDRWAVAQPTAKEGTILVATCVMDRCGALLEWRLGGAGPVVPDGAEHRSRWPAWATWTLLGVGAAAVAGATIGLDVALQPHPPESTFFGQHDRVTGRRPPRAP